MDPARGRLLVATPALRDPNFDRAVVLLLEHSTHGSVGLVLNRPSDTAVGDVLDAWAVLAAEPGAVFIGGPVAPQGAIGLAHCGLDPSTVEGFAELFAGVGTVDLERSPAREFDRFRLFAGYAGWSAGQLEAEIAEGSWFVVEAESDDLWTRAPHALWTRVLRRQPAPLALFAFCPQDPSTN